MFSLLVVSLALSTAASVSAQAPVASAEPLLAPSQPFVLIQPNEPMQEFDNLEIHPESDVCYKIRAFLFTKGQNPRYLRETTCPPTRASAKQANRTKPGLMPLELKARPDRAPQQ
jgi:hypothetical protein